jgi:hypothetical protein
VSGESEEEFLTGVKKFPVMQIEVFEIADSMDRPTDREWAFPSSENARFRGSYFARAISHHKK